MQNFSARSIIFESPALLNFNYLPEHTHTRCTSMCIGFPTKVLVALLCAVMDDMSPGRELFLRVCGLQDLYASLVFPCTTVRTEITCVATKCSREFPDL